MGSGWSSTREHAPGGDARARHGLRKSGNLRRRARALGQSKFPSFIFHPVRPLRPASRRPLRRRVVPPPSLAAAVPRDVVVRPSVRPDVPRGSRDAAATPTPTANRRRRIGSFKIKRVRKRRGSKSSHAPLESTRRTSSRVQSVVIWSQ